MVSGEARYVGFYTVYEKKGEEVLEEYIDWLSKNSPGGWHRKIQRTKMFSMFS